MSNLMGAVRENAGYVIGFVLIIVLLFVLALVFERWNEKRLQKAEPGSVRKPEKLFSTRKVVMIGMFSAVSTVLMMFELPLPFAPSFYKLDFSEVPILIGGFAFGPAAGVMMEFVKILLKLLVKGTSTAFVGELANFAVGCSLVLTSSVIYTLHKTRKQAVLSLVAGTLVMSIFGTAFNAIYLLPAFSALYGMPMDVLLAMGTAVNPLAKEGSIVSFVVACVLPLNLIKGAVDSLLTLLVYKKISPILKG